MYNSEAGQTDSTPFITASGDRVYDGGIACPSRFKFGTKVEVKGKIYKCNDRMNTRYSTGNYFDIWTEEKQDALTFGRQSLQVKVYVD